MKILVGVVALLAAFGGGLLIYSRFVRNGGGSPPDPAASQASQYDRESYARSLDRRSLDHGLDLKPRATGADERTLRLASPLCGRVLMRQMWGDASDPTPIRTEAASMGFDTIECIGGMDGTLTESLP